MPLVEILKGVVAAGLPRKPGERLTVEGNEARLLTSLGRARLASESLPVVMDQEPPKPKRTSTRKRQSKPQEAPVGEPPASTKLERARDDEGQFLGDDPATPDTNEAWVTVNADPAAE